MPDHDASHYVEERLNDLDARVTALESQSSDGSEVEPSLAGDEELATEPEEDRVEGAY